jgi:regulator of replication initiation timing
MGLLDGLEKLINEHGSSTILRERIELANDKYAVLESKVAVLDSNVANLESEKSALHSENEALKLDNHKLREQIQILEKRVSHSDNPKGYVCDHCGSRNLIRIGSRPDKTFGPLGGKQAIFKCGSCGGESAFLETP